MRSHTKSETYNTAKHMKMTSENERSIKFSKEGWLGEKFTLLTKLVNKLTASLSTETMEDRRYWNDDLKR